MRGAIRASLARRARGVAALAAVAATGVATAAGGLVAASAARGACVPLQTCPQPSSPKVEIGNPEAGSRRTEVFTGTIDPEGSKTTWKFEYWPANGDGATRATPTQTISASSTGGVSVRASSLSLEGSTVYSVALVATNATGTTTSQTQFRTPPTPLKVGVRAPTLGHRFVVWGAELRPHARLTGDVKLYVKRYGAPTLWLFWEKSRHRRPPGPPFTRVGKTLGYATAGDRFTFYDVVPTRNTFFRAELSGQGGQPGALSRPTLLYVLPYVRLSVQRPDPDKPRVEAIWWAQGPVLSRHTHVPDVFFYRRAPGSKLFVRFAARRPRQVADADAEIEARVSFDDPDAADVFTCVRTRLVPDMGPAFLDRSCGRPRLPGSV